MDITSEGWSRVISTNLTGPFLMTQRAARRMTDRGAVVNIASIDAHVPTALTPATWPQRLGSSD